MKALFLVFHGFEEYNGISKKIIYQTNALSQCGINVKLCYQYISDSQRYYCIIDDEIIKDYGKGLCAKIKKRIDYSALIDYITQNTIEFIYVRYDHNANPFLINLLKKIRKMNVIVFMEIPTYPYDGEYMGLSFSLRLQHFIDKLFRKGLARNINRIVTFSNLDRIFNVPTINISNGIDFDHIKIKNQANTLGEIRLIGVADIHLWHGFDRVIMGLYNYYKENHTTKIFFDIIGDGVPEVIYKLKQMVEHYALNQVVTFWGPKWGQDLDALFDEANLAIASLARHRSGITYIKTLKNREYAARGIPFVYSEIDDDFEDMPYVLKVPADDTPINIQSLIDFYHSVKMNPQEIRNSIIDELSWNKQMKIVIDQIKDINENT